MEPIELQRHRACLFMGIIQNRINLNSALCRAQTYSSATARVPVGEDTFVYFASLHLKIILINHERGKAESFSSLCIKKDTKSLRRHLYSPPPK